LERFVPVDRGITVTSAQGERQAGPGGCQPLKPEVGEQSSGADVPRIREHERLVATVQMTESLAAPDAFRVIHTRSDPSFAIRFSTSHRQPDERPRSARPEPGRLGQPASCGVKTITGIAISAGVAPP